jgi:hypothetical protein
MTKQIIDRIKIRSVSDGTRMGVGPMRTKLMTKQIIDRIKIRSVSDGMRMGVGPHAN